MSQISPLRFDIIIRYKMPKISAENLQKQSIISAKQKDTKTTTTNQ